MSELPTVLVVDDEPLNCELLKRALGSKYQVRMAADTSEATQQLDPSVAVMVCDQMMPGQHGSDFAQECKERWPHLVVVLLTGYPDAPEISQALEKGAIFAVMDKPMVIGQLRNLVEHAAKEHLRRKG